MSHLSSNKYKSSRPAVAAHHADPSIDAQQERCPERQDDEQQQDIAPGAFGARYAKGHGVTQEQAQARCNQRIAERGEIAPEINII